MADRVAGGWDFFVSYTQADRAWAEWIAWQLEEDGHRVLVQAWDFVPGTNWTRSMQEGVARSDRTIVVLSEAYLESVYGTAEWLAAWRADPTGEERKLLGSPRARSTSRPGPAATNTPPPTRGRAAVAMLREARLRAITGAPCKERRS